MPTFLYRAKDGPARTLEGELEADSRGAALLAVDAMGYSPVWVREIDGPRRTRRRRLLRNRRVRRRDVTLFTRQVASLTRAGVPILRALATIANQTESARFAKVVRDVESTIRDGSMLSEALAKFPKLFPQLYINMVRSGESGGILDTILTRLTDAREREDEMRRKVQAATAYPLLIITVGIGTVFVLLTFFLPRVLDLFKDFEKLPFATRLLIGISETCSTNWHWILIFVLLFIAVLRRIAAGDKGKSFFDAMKLRLPLIGVFLRQSDVARFARTLALLIEAGIPIDRALLLARNTLHNAVLREEIDQIHNSTVRQGMPLSDGLRRSSLFPPLVSNMAAVGEEGGRLDEALFEVAQFYEKEVEQQSRLAMSLLEPILILVVGAIVGLIVAAMLLPIFELSTTLQ
jgi:general secretion pathway protein F